MNWEDKDANRLIVQLAELNQNLRRLDAEPLISVRAAQAMAEAGDFAGLHRAVLATVTHLGHLIGLMGYQGQHIEGRD